jgi:HD-like signal output (HDOD) protein/DNA-binding NarL/FixJ family response regulator
MATNAGRWAGRSDNMARILIIDDLAIFREPLSASLRLAGHQTETAKDAFEGLARLRTSPVDLVLLDIAMPGMTGLQFIESIRANPKLSRLPIILLSAVEDRKMVLRAAQLGVKDYLLKSRFSTGELLERVSTRLAEAARASRERAASAIKPAAEVVAGPPAKIPVLLTRDQCVARVEKAISARPMSGVVSQVVGMASSPVADISALATLISHDPMLSTRVLKVANSAAFAGKRKMVTTVQEAVRNIGMSAVRDIATAASIYDAVPAGGADGFHHLRSWQHSFAAAMICQRLAEESGVVQSGAAYLAGLCHDLGQILFRGEFGREYAEVLKQHDENGLSMEQLERQMLGMTQLDLAKVILKKLGLPDDIRLPIEEFHTARNKPDHRVALPLSRLLHLADRYANGLLLAAMPKSEVGPLLKSECRAATGNNDPARPDAEALRGQILALTPLLSRVPVEEEQKLSKPILANSGKRVLMIREAVFSTFDPLEAGLASLAEVKVSEEMPESGAEGDWDALVVVARKRYPIAPGETRSVLRMAMEAAPEAAEATVTDCGLKVSLQFLTDYLSKIRSTGRKAA